VLPQPHRLASRIAAEMYLTLFRLFNTGLHSGKMLALV